MKINLNELIEAIEDISDEIESFYNKKTETIVTLFNDNLPFDVFEAMENLENYPDWIQDGIKSKYDIECNPENYISLPEKYDINDYSIMENFIYSIEDKSTKEKLLSLISGKGAFRRFRDFVENNDLIDNWYKFKEESYKQIAIEWCKSNNISY
ncbi:UPF0158 family protein [Clostridium bornimense]|uniref:UPF0158 family protein n=1 Tax=Clostridium bornimense TaxID=1216932 RepID=UPI001C116A1D|nr:UPF0158 family protein [Clostridium bornimense]MBU5316165.1 UPF0158 family protein [Clostridium bornimense]